MAGYLKPDKGWFDVAERLSGRPLIDGNCRCSVFMLRNMLKCGMHGLRRWEDLEMAGYLKPDKWRFDVAGKIIRMTLFDEIVGSSIFMLQIIIKCGMHGFEVLEDMEMAGDRNLKMAA